MASDAPATPASDDADVRLAVENVSKKFLLGGARGSDLRDRFSLSGLLRRGAASADPSGPKREFWALQEVDFTIRRGEAVGIVGHNGSGKSTLLKMLTGILPPTTGRVRTHGRIGALIEVGAGFHPDLSGRENIYLNGSILGLSRREIATRFDQIVAFAGLEKFIDTPVKRYSSGMYMRLGFSIAAHLDPEILLVDEVLAVGDAYFQNKCLRHLRQFVAQGGTVLLVSHATEQVRGFCDRCLWLDHGQLLRDGPAGEVLDEYMQMVARREDDDFRHNHPAEWEMRQAEERERREEEERAAREAEERARREAEEQARREEEERAAREAGRLTVDGPPSVRLLKVEMVDEGGEQPGKFRTGASLTLRISYEAERAVERAVVGIGINRRRDRVVCYGPNTREDGVALRLAAGAGAVEVTFPELLLLADDYTVDVALLDGEDVIFYREEAAAFAVTDPRAERGVCRMGHVWRHTPATASEPRVLAAPVVTE